jgi:putative ABC transport system permease protein
MLMAVLERTREIGILMALGASRRTIAWIFLFEAAWLGFLGAAVGIAGGFLIGRLIMFGVNTYFAVAQKEAGEVTTFLKFNVSLMYIIGTLAAATLLTMLAGWLPARRAAKQNPVDSLRHE